MSPDPRLDPAELLAHVGWIRGLAARLVGDAERAEDLAQEACVAALEQPPRQRESLRRWLASVLRNRAREDARGSRRRVEREVRVARPEAQGSTLDALERASTQHALVAALLRLDEPYRSAILLRFFEELPPREIARRLDAPVATVQSRITRGLARLRAELDGEHGGRRGAWLPAVALLAERPAGAASLSLSTLGALAVNAKLALCAVVVAVAGGAVAVWTLSGASPEPRALAVAPPSQPEPAAERELTRTAGDAAGAPRAAVPAPEGERVASAEPAPRAAAPTTVEGVVLDAGGLPLAGIEVRFEGEVARAEADPAATSDRAGRFTVRAPDTAASLVAVTPGWATVKAGAHAPGRVIGPVVVVAPAVDYAGRVTDPAGEPLSGVAVRLELPNDLDARLATPLESTRVRGWSTRTGEDGRFELARTPRVDGARLSAELDGWLPARVDAPPFDDRALELVLARPAAGAGDLTGRVVDPGGKPVEGARVALGLTSAVTDEGGRFALSLRRAGTDERVVAVLAGHLPASMERPAAGGWPSHVELRLGAAPLSIRGHVKDGEGEPVPGALVWAADPTHLGLANGVPVQVEYALAGGPTTGRGLRLPDGVLDDPLSGDSYTDITPTMDEPTAHWFFVLADRTGTFEVPGLLEREYRLRAFDPATLRMTEGPPTAAGARDAVLELDERVHERVAGRVVSRRGAPVSGAEIVAFRPLFELRARVPGGLLDVSVRRPGPVAITGSDGAFELLGLPREGVLLEVSGDTIVPFHEPLPVLDDATELELEAVARCHLEVVLAETGRADAIAVQDAHGEALDVHVIRDGSHNAYTSVPLYGDGTGASGSGVVGVSEEACTLVLLQDGVPVERLPLDLVPGSTTVVRP